MMVSEEATLSSRDLARNFGEEQGTEGKRGRKGGGRKVSSTLPSRRRRREAHRKGEIAVDGCQSA